MTGIITFAPRFNNDFSLVDWFYRKKEGKSYVSRSGNRYIALVCRSVDNTEHYSFEK